MTTNYSQYKKEFLTLSILVLLAVALVLVLFNKNREVETDEVTAKTVHIDPVMFRDKLIAVMQEFGMEDSLIKQLNSKLAKKNKVTSLYQVYVPKDLPVPFLLHELQRLLPQVTMLTPVEKSINGDCYIDISPEKGNIYRFEFLIKGDLVRDAGMISLVIFDADEITDEEWPEFLQYATEAAFIVSASVEGKVLAGKIVAAGKNYIVRINDKTNEIDYKLGEDYPLSRLNFAMGNIITGFPHALYYVADASSQIYTTSIRTLFEQKLKKQGKQLKKFQGLPLLPEQGDYSHTLSYLLTTASKTDKAPVICLTASQYKGIETSLHYFKKRGGKIVPLTVGVK